ncbi:hypothetical protein H6G45_09600 [Synechocystis sp. FACHB-383]|uniref:Ycf66 family protein n=1 Tax=Synechocystis sp. FACHB-383 TaxID=2692864 RepID=UPI00168456CE|nr:Ycf66 family protein [Synechocystis sp. FACHB-383]MBD2653739.1 hypothetical protein [Synechocystis sp. FACHB-383]
MLALMLSGAVALASLAFFFSAFFAPKLHRKDDFLWSGVGFFYGLVLWNCAQRFTGAILLGQAAVVVLVLAFAWQTLRLRAAIARQSIVEVPSFSLLDWLAGGLQRKPKAKTPAKDKDADGKQTETEIEPGTAAVKQDLPATGEPSELGEDSIPVNVPSPITEEVAEAIAQGSTDISEEVEGVIETAETVVEELNETAETVAEDVVEKAEEAVEKIVEITDQAEEITVQSSADQSEEVLLKKPKSKLFQRLFGRKKPASPPAKAEQSTPTVVEQTLNPESESTNVESDDWDDGEDWGEDLSSVNSDGVLENSDGIADDKEENNETDETQVIAVVETVQIEQQITLVEVPDSGNVAEQEQPLDVVEQDDHIIQEEAEEETEDIFPPTSEATAMVVEKTVEEVPDPETEIQQGQGGDETEVTSEEVTEAIAGEPEDLPKQPTDSLNPEDGDGETANDGDGSTEEKQNWADG